MNKNDKEILDRLLPSVIDKTISRKDREQYEKLLQKEWDNINLLKNKLIKYYPFARY